MIPSKSFNVWEICQGVCKDVIAAIEEKISIPIDTSTILAGIDQELRAANIDPARISDVPSEKLHAMISTATRKVLTTSFDESDSDSDIGSVTSVEDLELEPSSREYAQHALAEIGTDLDALLLLADRAIDEAAAHKSGIKTAKPFSDKQLAHLLSLFDETVAKCHSARDFAATHELTHEFLQTYALEQILIDTVNILAPDSPKTSRVSIQEQLGHVWQLVDKYESLASRGLSTAGVVERRLLDAEKFMQNDETGEQTQKLTEAKATLHQIKTHMSELTDSLKTMSDLSGPGAIALLDTRISASLDHSQELRTRAQDMYYLQTFASNGLKDCRAELLQKLHNYSAASIELLNKEESIADNARELKSLCEEYETLNTGFSKTLDQIESQIQEILDKEAAVQRKAEAKQQFQEIHTRSKSHVHHKALSEVLTKGPKPRKAAKQSADVNRLQPLSAEQKTKLIPLQAELQKKLTARMGIHERLSAMTKSERIQARQELAQRLRSKLK